MAMVRAFAVSAVALLLVLGSSAAYAAMSKAETTAFVSSCEKQMYMSAGECSCMAGIADKTLDQTAIAYLSLDALDVRHSAAMSKSMSGKERNSIDHFMSTAPHQCKGAK